MGKRWYSTYTLEQLAEFVKESTSYRGVLQKSGLKPTGGNYAVLKMRIKERGLDTSYQIRVYNWRMPKYIELKAHLSVDELEKRYRSANDVVARSQWQILWLISSGKRSREVSQVTGYSADWIRILIQRYNRLGIVAVGDGRHANAGQARLLNT